MSGGASKNQRTHINQTIFLLSPHFGRQWHGQHQENYSCGYTAKEINRAAHRSPTRRAVCVGVCVCAGPARWTQFGRLPCICTSKYKINISINYVSSQGYPIIVHIFPQHDPCALCCHTIVLRALRSPWHKRLSRYYIVRRQLFIYTLYRCISCGS